MYVGVFVRECVFIGKRVRVCTFVCVYGYERERKRFEYENVAFA